MSQYVICENFDIECGNEKCQHSIEHNPTGACATKKCYTLHSMPISSKCINGKDEYKIRKFKNLLCNINPIKQRYYSLI